MLSCRFSRVYAAGVMGAIAVAFAIACQQTSDPPPSPPDDLAMGDMAVGPDLSPYNTPVITSISPTSGLNNVATSITITGTDFRPGAQVTVGGAACTGVSVASSTTISCTVPAKAVTCGPRDIVVTHPDDGKSATGVKLFTYRSIGPIGFGAFANYATAAGPRRVIAVDTNADGNLDLVNVNQAGNSITVKTGLGDGTFPAGASQNLTLGNGASGPADLVTGDVNKDGKPDIVVVNSGASNISVFLNMGASIFAPASVIATPGITAANSIAIGDITGDGNLDLVIASSSSASVLPLIGNGSGGFTPAAIRSVAGNVSDLALADLNGDSKLDLVTANSSTGNVSVCNGNGTGTFANPTNQNTGSGASGVFVTDLDGDKKLDVVVSNATAMNVSVLTGDGTGALALPVNQPLSTARPESVWVTDLSGDGLLDIVTANNLDNTVSYLQGITAKQYAAAVTSNSGAGPAGIIVADLNGDRLPDIALASSATNNVQVALQLCK